MKNSTKRKRDREKFKAACLAGLSSGEYQNEHIALNDLRRRRAYLPGHYAAYATQPNYITVAWDGFHAWNHQPKELVCAFLELTNEV